MPTSRSSSNLNTRLFAPTVVLTQDTRRLFITISSASGSGYTVDASIAAGDVIRYDPVDQSYKPSQANTERNSEVLGIVESITGTNYTVVTAGSITYPTARLTSIIEGGTGGKDILFLDPSVAGGLTGVVEVPTGTNSAIVKPVLQLAPHSIYNGIIVNYIGYKIGNAAAIEGILPVGDIIWSPPDVNPGSFYKKADGFELSVTEYPDMYSLYGLTNGPHKIKLQLNSAVGISSGLSGSNVTQYYNGSVTTIGTVSSWDSVNETITISRTVSSPQIINGSTVYSKGFSWTLESNTPISFTVPAVQTTVQQGDITLVPYISVKPMVDITIPESITIENLIVSQNAEIGSITDLEQTINQIQADITTIKNTLRIGGS